MRVDLADDEQLVAAQRATQRGGEGLPVKRLAHRVLHGLVGWHGAGVALEHFDHVKAEAAAHEAGQDEGGSQLSVGPSTTELPQTAAQSASLLWLQPDGQQASPLAQPALQTRISAGWPAKSGEIMLARGRVA